MERSMVKVSHNISVIQEAIAKEHRYEWATGVLVYIGVIVILILTMTAYCVCLYRGMKGQYDMNLALRGQPINTLELRNPLYTSLSDDDIAKRRSTAPDVRRASLLLPGQKGPSASSTRRGSRSSRHSSRRASDCGSDSDESVIIAMN